ncbi:MAG TPA: enolase C-terminal domain-like protein, partial [Acidimicrobiales bacterium]|nr:enolase C-terminal domain-like protein [Acidimicrobiales bacterium]
CVCCGGITGLRDLARRVEAAGRVFTPHTWGNGIGLLANLHLSAGATTAPFVEFPFDPPEWTTARRDFPLAESVESDAEGWITLSEAPGLGLRLDEARLASTLSAHATFT